MAFGAGDPLADLPPTNQVNYLRCYLNDLGAKTVLVEPNYFDRDYLAEFAAFYSISASGYKNVCRRVHFFDSQFDRATLRRAVSGSQRVQKRLQNAYLGFVIIRPIPAAPLGRTVLKWYPDPDDKVAAGTPRIVEPSREYRVHIAGVAVHVSGVAWQQQDSAVGACATIALWSMLHSSAFDEHHAIPTTAEITAAAHRTASLGARVFPSVGLTVHQELEAIKEHGLSPIALDGALVYDGDRAFDRERFAASCAAFIRSGYPVLIRGRLEKLGNHAVCCVGFRSSVAPAVPQGTFQFLDADTPHIYIHDDNLGPNVRFEVIEENGVVMLKASAPPPRNPPVVQDPTASYPRFIPTQLIVAVHHDLRTSADALHRAGIKVTQHLSALAGFYAANQGIPQPGLSLTTRYVRVRDYLGRELARTLGSQPDVLAKTRMFLVEEVPPMSMHLGVVRIGDGAKPVLDVLYDTTDSDRNLPPFAHVAYTPNSSQMIELLATTPVFNLKLGIRVDAF